MTTPTFTTPPTMPARTQQPADYIANFNAFLAWLAVFFGEMVGGISWLAIQVGLIGDAEATCAASAADAQAASTVALAVTGFIGLSTANLAVSAGVKNVTGLTGKSFTNGPMATLIYRPDPTIRMRGVVSNANMGAGTMDVTVAAGAFSGSGTLSDWRVLESALESISPDLAKKQAISFAVAL